MSVEINLKLARILGVDTDRCSGFDLRVRAAETPSVTVYRHVADPDEAVKRFSLVDDIEPDVHDAYIHMLGRLMEPREPFDLDKLCAEAMARVERGIFDSYHLARLTLGFDKPKRYINVTTVDSPVEMWIEDTE